MHHDGGTMMEAPSVSRSPQREDQHRFDGRLSAFHVGKDEVAWMGLASCKAATCTSLQKHMSSCLRCWSIHLLTSMWQACLLTSMTFPCSGWLWVPQAHRLSRLWLGAIAMSPICRRQQVFGCLWRLMWQLIQMAAWLLQWWTNKNFLQPDSRRGDRRISPDTDESSWFFQHCIAYSRCRFGWQQQQTAATVECWRRNPQGAGRC